MAFQAGKHKKVVGLDITEYCPGMEDYRTGILISNIIYYFIMGYSLRA
jgi:formiminoglutamase